MLEETLGRFGNYPKDKVFISTTKASGRAD